MTSLLISFFSFSERTGLPFARLKLKPVQRMSCMLDYHVSPGLEGLEGERINKRESRVGRAVGGRSEAGVRLESNNLGQCFLCPEPATLKVSLPTCLPLTDITRKYFIHFKMFAPSHGLNVNLQRGELQIDRG